MNQPQKCAHPECLCQTREGSDYCSPYCTDAAARHNHDQECQCGHPECAGD
jgi:hypothetical protein